MGKDGNLYVTDSYYPGGMNPSSQHLIRKVTTNGVVTTLTGELLETRMVRWGSPDSITRCPLGWTPPAISC